jgi:hypothetical protein
MGTIVGAAVLWAISPVVEFWNGLTAWLDRLGRR